MLKKMLKKMLKIEYFGVETRVRRTLVSEGCPSPRPIVLKNLMSESESMSESSILVRVRVRVRHFNKSDFLNSYME